MESLLDLIEESGFSRYEVSEKIGVSRAAIDSWIKGKSFPSKFNSSRLSDILKVSFDELKSCIPIVRNTEFALILKKRRKEEGLRQKDVAERIGIKEVTISNWERGKEIPAKKYHAAIERIFSINILDYIG